MLDKLVILLDKIANQIFAVLTSISNRVIPKRVKPLNKKTVRKKIDFDNLKKRLFEKTKKMAIISKNLTKKAQNSVEKIKKIDVKKRDYKKDFSVILTAISVPLLFAKKWYLTLKPATIMIGVTGLAFSGLAITSIYQATQKISEEEAKVREVASVKQVTSVDVDSAGGTKPTFKRGKYYKIDKKTFGLSDVFVPVYYEGSGSIRTVIFDVKIEGSNQYIKQYFETHEDIIRNKLTTTIESVTPKFLLTIEGKKIIKDKIKAEINIILKELKIKGSIKKIYLSSIMAS